ncbi:MAG: DUF2189 domain-containing protein [Pseudomonadota bacterium]
MGNAADATGTHRETLRRKARIANEEPIALVRQWLSAGLEDVKTKPELSLFYGLGLAASGWIALIVLWTSDLQWTILPLLAAGLLAGPVATVGLYRAARRNRTGGGRGVASPGQIAVVGTILMVLALVWFRAATILFALFYGLVPFGGFVELLGELFTTGRGIALVAIGSAVGGLFAAFTFAISAFSIPMLVDREIDAFSAMALSFNAATQNFRLVVAWGIAITGLTVAGIATGLLGLIVIFPWLGYATWHAYCDLFEVTA